MKLYRPLLALWLAFVPFVAMAQLDPALPREVLVLLAPGNTIEPIAQTYGLTVSERFGQRPIWRVRVNAPLTVAEALTSLNADARVQVAERNFEDQTPEGRRNAVWAIGGSQSGWTSQWAARRIRLSQAHQLAKGAGVRVAVLDTGVELTHPILAQRLARRLGGSVLGRDFVDDDADPSEQGTVGDAGYGHGTHVAGLIARVAPQSRIMPVRVLDAAGRGNLWVLSEALLWAVDPDGNPQTDDGAHVVNLSLGTLRRTQLLDLAIELATCSDDDDDEEDLDTSDPGFDADRARCDARGGVVVMAAAGNAGTTQRQYPAAEAALGKLSVTASTAQNRLADFANRGLTVEIVAPGDQIISAVPGGGWGVWSGTSMAAPMAAGVAALVRQLNPDWKAADVTSRLRDRSAALCGTTLRQVDAYGAVADQVPPDLPC
ncbi:MAG TPA: S8 family serine peptidase [Methylibium sp.]|nr:S8 family serine peptidase [Methylibium sp.]